MPHSRPGLRRRDGFVDRHAVHRFVRVPALACLAFSPEPADARGAIEVAARGRHRRRRLGQQLDPHAPVQPIVEPLHRYRYRGQILIFGTPTGVPKIKI
jgi:hypothetical protein